MAQVRPFGVTLISGLYFIKAIAMAAAIAVALIRPDLMPQAQSFAVLLAPLLHLVHSNLWLVFAPLFVLLGIAISVGVWFCKGWSWGLLIVLCGVPLIRLIQFVFISLIANHAWLSHIPASPFFAVDLTTSILIVCYLLQDDVKSVFKDSP